MKKELKHLLVVNALLVGLVLYYTFDLLMLCVDNPTEDAFLPSQLESNGEPSSVGITGTHASVSPQLIPKIIHQTYKTEEIPEQWRAGQQRCRDLHPDYEYILWTDAMATAFIKEEYPWFLETFENYKYPIQRADAIRYFLLVHYGGVYIDLDDACERRLDPLLTVPAFVRQTNPTGVSNDVMGSVPRHPFFLKVLESLIHYDKNWYVPYVTIMGSTGPLFISVIWEQYKRANRGNNVAKNPTDAVVRVLQPEFYKMTSDSFFSISKGSSWHLNDAKFVKSLANHILSCVVAGFIIAFAILYSEYIFYVWLCSRNSNYQLSNQNSPTADTIHEQNSHSSATPFAYKLKNFYMSLIYGKSEGYPGYEFDMPCDWSSTKSKLRRLRKDSNVPFHNIVADLEKSDPKFTDLSH